MQHVPSRLRVCSALWTGWCWQNKRPFSAAWLAPRQGQESGPVISAQYIGHLMMMRLLNDKCGMCLNYTPGSDTHVDKYYLYKIGEYIPAEKWVLMIFLYESIASPKNTRPCFFLVFNAASDSCSWLTEVNPKVVFCCCWSSASRFNVRWFSA